MKQTRASCSDLLSQAKRLEAKFLASLSDDGVLDGSVQNICSKIRHLYESIILADPAFAEVQNVEHSLWELHYKQIEEFRHHVCSDREWIIARDGCARTALAKEKWRELLQSKPILAGFRSFLTEASGFYHELILKLQANLGVVRALESKQHQQNKALNFKRCQKSCYRCLVNLGDYARYKEFYVGNDPFSHDFSVASGFYRKAIVHWPVGGQPHNQLAVLAVYVEDDLLAVYHYFRSLAVENPFPTSRENLTILFEKNRVKYECLPLHSVKLAVPLSTRKTSQKVKPSLTKTFRKVSAKQTGRELVNQFFVRFMRLNGLFFTKTSLEKFEEVYAGVHYDLEQLLALDDKNLEEALGSGSCFGMARELHGSFGALKVVVILICTLENIFCGSNCTEAPMQKVLFQNAFKAILSIVGHFMERCAEAHDACVCPLLPALLVFFEWFTCRPDIIHGIDKDDEHFNLLSLIWKHFMRLTNRFYEESFEKVTHDWRDFALWEDNELQGFSPLSSSRFALSHGDRSRYKGAEDWQFRCCRLVASGDALASIAKGSSLSAMFGQAEAKLEKLEESFDCRVSKIHRGQVLQVKEQEERCGQHFKYDDDDDEELIVFQPAAKEQLLLSAANTAVAEPLSGMVPVLEKAPFCSPSPDCLPKPSRLYAADTYKSAAVNLHSLDLRLFTAPSPEAEQSIKVGATLSSKQATMPLLKQPSGNHISSCELRSYLEPRKATNSLGVIGQPKQIQDGMQELVKGSDWMPNNKSQCNAASHVCKQEPPSSIFNKKQSKEFQGNLCPLITSKLLSKQSSSDYTGTRVMRPPPGFAPQPTLPPVSLKLSDLNGEKELLQNESREKELKFTPCSAEKHRAPPGYGLWSAVNNKVFKSGSEMQLSFSSMSHPGSPVAQKPVYMANEKMTWSLFGTTAGYNWTPTLIS